MTFTPEQTEELKAPLMRDHVAEREQAHEDREVARRVKALLAPGGKFDAADPLNAEYSAADLVEVAEFQAEEDMFYASLPRAAGQMIP